MCNYDNYIFKWLHKLGSLDSMFHTGFCLEGRLFYVILTLYVVHSSRPGGDVIKLGFFQGGHNHFQEEQITSLAPNKNISFSMIVLTYLRTIYRVART